MEPVTLTDGTITLRPWTPEDVSAVHAAVQDPEVPRYMNIPANHTVEGVTRWISSRPEGFAGGNDPGFAIVDSEDGRLLGSMGVERSADDPAIGEVGYWMVAEERGRGIAQRAVRLVLEWAFDALDLARLEITTHVDNVASRCVAAATGFREEGLLRSYREQHGRRVDLVMHERLRED